MPVASDRLTGNKVSNLFTSLRTDLDDPVERLARHPRRHRRGEGGPQPPRRRHARRLDASTRRRGRTRGPCACTAGRTSPTATARRSTWWCRTCPGRATRSTSPALGLAGIWSVGPILEGVGLNVTVWSYLDKVHVGAIGCREHWRDLHVVTDGMVAALADLVAAKRVT